MDARAAHLLSLLEAHEPADELEHTHLEKIVAVVAGGGDPFSRSRFEPGHVTASVFLTRPGELYLIHHKKLERWLQPGGHVEPGDETVQKSAARELREEVSVVVEVPPRLFDVDVHEIPARKSEPAHLHLDVRFCVALPAGQQPRASDEVNAGAFFPLSLLPETDESVRRAVRKLR